MSIEDFNFLSFSIAGQVNFLHTIKQWFRNISFIVGRSDEQYIRQINRNINKVIYKGVILVGVQNFK